MAQTLAAVALVVRDYDEAIAHFTQTLGFELLEDTPPASAGSEFARRPPGAPACSWPAPRPTRRARLSATNLAAGSFCFSTPTISGRTIVR
jgi:catechol 2,3-dioxygenase-like lactoylglutathione lyase family enzyme